MREVRISDVTALLPQLLEEVERGETIIITREGRPIARIVPEPCRYQRDTKAVLAEIDEFRKRMPRIPLEEILSTRHEGHKY
jgi:prevent-host-death family protein